MDIAGKFIPPSLHRIKSYPRVWVVCGVTGRSASADQRKALLRQIRDGWRKVQLTDELWLDRMSIGRGYVGQVVDLQAPDVTGHQFLGQPLLLRRDRAILAHAGTAAGALDWLASARATHEVCR